MNSTSKLGTLRRSFALPKRVVEAAVEAAPPELKSNLNRLMTVALEKYVEWQEQVAFSKAMEEMASDSDIRKLNKAIEKEFNYAINDGLAEEK